MDARYDAAVLSDAQGVERRLHVRDAHRLPSRTGRAWSGRFAVMAARAGPHLMLALVLAEPVHGCEVLHLADAGLAAIRAALSAHREPASLASVNRDARRLRTIARRV